MEIHGFKRSRYVVQSSPSAAAGAAKKRDFMSDECRFRVLHGLPDSGPMKIYELAGRLVPCRPVGWLALMSPCSV